VVPQCRGRSPQPRSRVVPVERPVEEEMLAVEAWRVRWRVRWRRGIRRLGGIIVVSAIAFRALGLVKRVY